MGKNQTARGRRTGLELKYKVYRERGQIMVEHENGYYGVLYGKRQLAIFKGNQEVLHAFNRAIDTAEELGEMLETMPEFLEMLEEEDRETERRS